MLMAVVIPLLVLPTLLSAYQVNDSDVSHERRLFRYLLNQYESSVRPVRHYKDNITVELGASLLNFDLDEETQVLQTAAWLRMDWTDFQLKWTPSDFGELTYIRIPIKLLWYPDITIYNSADPDLEFPTHHMALASSDGKVTWIPPVVLRTHCSLDVLYFPFDTQICSIKFGSWVYDQLHVDLVFAYGFENVHVDVDMLVKSKQWQLVNTSATRNVVVYPCCVESYVDITYRLELQRHSSFGLHLFLLPSVILSLVIPVVFVLPTGSNGKITLGVGVLIAHVLLLGEVIKFVPSGHHISIPLMAKFSMINVVLVSLSLIVSTVVVNLWSRGVNRLAGPSNFIKQIFMQPVFTRILCIDFTQYAYGSEHGFDNPLSVIHNIGGSTEVIADPNDSTGDKIRIMQDKERHVVASEWQQLADVIDRLFLILYFIIVVITSLSFLHYL